MLLRISKTCVKFASALLSASTNTNHKLADAADAKAKRIMKAANNTRLEVVYARTRIYEDADKACAAIRRNADQKIVTVSNALKAKAKRQHSRAAKVAEKAKAGRV